MFLSILVVTSTLLFMFPSTSVATPSIEIPQNKPLLRSFREREPAIFVDDDACVNPNPPNTLSDRINSLLSLSGADYVLSLCPKTQYFIESAILFAAPYQEISTQGYPTGDDRATLVVNGLVFNGTGHTTAVDGQCEDCRGVRLRNVQINGMRLGAPPTAGGANIEMGGSNSGQLIEYVRSFDPRSWSCLHIAEGQMDCDSTIVRNNDIGPCGLDAFDEWADGISVSCSNSLVANNSVNNPTDGGIVLFGSPGTLVENNTIWVESQTLLGGINLVDYEGFDGNYTNTVVRNNTIMGGYSTSQSTYLDPLGPNINGKFIKIGIAIGPRTWFGDKYGNSISFSGTVVDNQLSGAFGYGIAMSSARNFTVENNILLGNTSFIGSRGPNCSSAVDTPPPAPFIMDRSTLTACTTQFDLQSVSNVDSLTCILPPGSGNHWPFRERRRPPKAMQSSPKYIESNPLQFSNDRIAGLLMGVVAGFSLAGLVTWFIRRIHHEQYWTGTLTPRNRMKNSLAYFHEKHV